MSVAILTSTQLELEVPDPDERPTFTEWRCASCGVTLITPIEGVELTHRHGSGVTATTHSLKGIR